MVLSDKRKVSIREVLRGMEIGRMQSVGLMSVIPLTMNEDLYDERFASPTEADVSTTNYGSMVFDNPTDQIIKIGVGSSGPFTVGASRRFELENPHLDSHLNDIATVVALYHPYANGLRVEWPLPKDFVDILSLCHE